MGRKDNQINLFPDLLIKDHFPDDRHPPAIQGAAALRLPQERYLLDFYSRKGSLSFFL